MKAETEKFLIDEGYLRSDPELNFDAIGDLLEKYAQSELEKAQNRKHPKQCDIHGVSGSLTTLNEALAFIQQANDEYRTYYSRIDGKVKEVSKLANDLANVIEKVRELLDRSYDAVKHTTRDRSLLDDLDEFLKTKN